MNKENYQYRFDTIFFITAFHALLPLVFFYPPTLGLSVTTFIILAAGGICLAAGFHRHLTHKGFKTPKWVEYTMTTIGCLTLQGSPIKWVAMHRKHHKFTDKDGDPHSPRDGFAFSHVFWTMVSTEFHNSPELLKQYAPDLLKDKFHLALHKVWWLPTIVLAAGLYYVWGWPGIVTGIFVRVVLQWHFTWLVNSACHIWGSKAEGSTDNSRNNWLVAILTWGEGWHSNHHVNPTRARHGLKWHQFDASWIFILCLKFIGLAKDIKLDQKQKPVLY